MNERESYESYRVHWWEKVLINFALPMDLVYHTGRALLQRDKSQTVWQRLTAMWRGKITKYQKLLRVKDENSGQIPEDYRELCRQTPCGWVRLQLARLKQLEAEEAAAKEAAGEIKRLSD